MNDVNVGMGMCVNTVYTSIPGLPEQLGMVWMGDVMMHAEPTHELMLDPRQTENPFFSHGSNPYEEIRNHHIGTTMVRYIPQQFSTECSEPGEAEEATDTQDLQGVSIWSLFKKIWFKLILCK